MQPIPFYLCVGNRDCDCETSNFAKVRLQLYCCDCVWLIPAASWVSSQCKQNYISPPLLDTQTPIPHLNMFTICRALECEHDKCPLSWVVLDVKFRGARHTTRHWPRTPPARLLGIQMLSFVLCDLIPMLRTWLWCDECGVKSCCGAWLGHPLGVIIKCCQLWHCTDYCTAALRCVSPT